MDDNVTATMPKNALIDAISREMSRVWGKDGLHGEPEEYRWLEKNYGISEGDDVWWQLTIQHHFGELPEEDWTAQIFVDTHEPLCA